MDTTISEPSFPPATPREPVFHEPVTVPPNPPATLNVIEKLLRAPEALMHDIDHAEQTALLRSLLLVLVITASAFGGVIGTYRGGIQIFFCAVKLPLVLIATLVVCAPAFVGLGTALRTGLGAREIITLTLAACSRFSLVLACLAPVVWLLSGWLGYHGVVVTLTVCSAIAGLAAAALLIRGLARRGGSAKLAGLAFAAVFALVGGQTSWLSRPFLVRPKTTNVPFLRHIEGDLFHSAQTSAHSAVGDYDDEEGAWLPSRGAATRKACDDANGASCD